MKKKLFAYALAACVVCAALVAVVFARWYQDNRKANFTKESVLYVYPDTKAEDVIDSLVKWESVINVKSLQRAFAKEKVETAIKPGRYVVGTNSPSIYVARMVTRGWQTPQNLTLSGTIRSVDKLARQISNQMMVSYEEVFDSLNDPSYIAQYGTDKTNLFGFFVPDTYQMYWTASLDEIMARFKKEYDEFWTPERIAKAKAQGLTQRQAITVASIVAGESRYEPELGKIAGVYLNRFHKGMKLQADPTICYCYNYELNRVLKKHLEVESPYNTYKYVGLPPGPINVPGKAYIDAVLNPDKHGYLFFCANSSFDGSHKFAVTYEEHMKNARDFQSALTARNRAKAAAEAAK